MSMEDSDIIAKVITKPPKILRNLSTINVTTMIIIAIII